MAIRVREAAAELRLPGGEGEHGQDDGDAARGHHDGDGVRDDHAAEPPGPGTLVVAAHGCPEVLTKGVSRAVHDNNPPPGPGWLTMR